ELWHERLLGQLRDVKVTLLIGQYSHRYVLQNRLEPNLTKTVKNWKNYTPNRLPLPHPSPRNNRWLKQNPWFAQDVIPYLKRRVKRLLSDQR
ncbi:MAG: uracil-DNA glycosylase family protein, partial [Planctomycetaceae bacterium]